MELPYDPAIPVLGIYPKKAETLIQKNICTPRVPLYWSIIYNCQDVEIVQVPISRWVDKKSVVHLYNGILFGHNKEGILTFWDSMDGPEEYYAKWNKPVRERQIPYDLTNLWNLMNKIN